VDLPGRSANVPWSTVTRDAFGNFEAGLIRATGLQVGSASVPNSVGMIQLASRSGAGSAARTWEVGVPETDENLSGTGYSFVVNDLGNGSAPELMVQFGTGNVGIGTTNPSAKLDVNGNINASGSLNLNTASYTGVTAFIRARPGDDIPLAVQGTDGVNLLLVETNGNVTAETFVNSSDRGRKTNFTSVSAANVLDKVASLPIQRWSFKSDATTTHIGPMAQDFYSAFGVGPDDKHITAVDAYGVALAAIQGLNEKIEAGSLRSEARTRSLEQKLQQRETEVTELKSRLEKLERLTMNNK
jgi:hypothetical protein